MKKALRETDREILHAENGFAEAVTRVANIFFAFPRKLREAFCPECKQHYTLKPENLRGWPSSVAHITCASCEKAGAG